MLREHLHAQNFLRALAREQGELAEKLWADSRLLVEADGRDQSRRHAPSAPLAPSHAPSPQPDPGLSLNGPCRTGQTM